MIIIRLSHILVILDTKVQTASYVSDPIFLHIKISKTKAPIKLKQKGNKKINTDHNFIHATYVITITTFILRQSV